MNQVRSSDLSTLTGLQYATGAAVIPDEQYLSTDEREMQAYLASMGQQPVGEELTDEDYNTFRAGL